MRKEGKEGCDGRPGKERAPLLFGILFASITLNFKHAKLHHNKYEQHDMMSCSRVSVLNKAVVLKLVTPITMF